MSMKTGSVLIVIAVILLNLLILGSGAGGRGSDYYENQRYEVDR